MQPPSPTRRNSSLPRCGLALLLLAASLTSGCGQSSSRSSSYGWGRGEPEAAYPAATPASGAYLIVPADHRFFLVQITSRQESLSAQLAEIIAARDLLHKAVESVGELTDFRVADPALDGQYPSKDTRKEPNTSMVQITFKQPKDALAQMTNFVKAVTGIKPPAGALWSFTLRGTGCTLTAPENYRDQLVAKAMEGLRGLRSVDTSRFKVTLTGLEKPLVVNQYSDSEFLISLQYSITVESVSEPAQPQTAKNTGA